jgi:ribonuclease E
MTITLPESEESRPSSFEFVSDPLAPNTDDHWRRLAAELGLEIGPEPEASAPAPEDHAAEELPPPAVEREPAEEEMEAPPPAANRGRRRRSSAAADDEAPAPSRSRRGRPAPEPVPEEVEAEELPELTEVDVNGPLAEPEPTGEPEAEFAPLEDEPAEEPAEKPRRRRRRGRRKKGEPAGEGGDAAATTDRAEPADEEPAPVTEETPEEVVSDWNVPSWDDLIASLYRPER